jgi:hypothetical protein
MMTSSSFKIRDSATTPGEKEFERRFYTGLYAACRGNVKRIAKVAGRQRVTVREALRDLGLYVSPESSTDEESKPLADPKDLPSPTASKDRRR